MTEKDTAAQRELGGATGASSGGGVMRPARRSSSIGWLALAPALAACGSGVAAPGSPSGSAPAPVAGGGIVVEHAEQRPPSKGPADQFIGDVTIAPLFGANDHRRGFAANVTFEAGARTAWHSHPAGQTLIVTEGTGWVQEWGGAKKAIQPGDVVWTPPGVKHWHGATPSAAMTHIAHLEHVDGEVVDWMEQVSDAQYGGKESP